MPRSHMHGSYEMFIESNAHREYCWDRDTANDKLFLPSVWTQLFVINWTQGSLLAVTQTEGAFAFCTISLWNLWTLSHCPSPLCLSCGTLGVHPSAKRRKVLKSALQYSFHYHNFVIFTELYIYIFLQKHCSQIRFNQKTH